eukprot:m51a1_g8177 putative domain containing protein (532) ;mRNA; f:117279-119064
MLRDIAQPVPSITVEDHCYCWSGTLRRHGSSPVPPLLTPPPPLVAPPSPLRTPPASPSPDHALLQPTPTTSAAVAAPTARSKSPLVRSAPSCALLLRPPAHPARPLSPAGPREMLRSRSTGCLECTRYTAGELVGATLPSLVALVTTPGVPPGDVDALVLTYRKFAAPAEFSSLICARARESPAAVGACCRLASRWAYLCYEADMAGNAPVLSELQAMAESAVAEATDDPGKEAGARLGSVLRAQSSGLLEMNSDGLLQCVVTTSPRLHRERSPRLRRDKSPFRFKSTKDSAVFAEVRHQEFAEQLTLVEYAYYSRIRPQECFGLAWAKPDAASRSPNLLYFTQQFNRISQWVVSTVLLAKDRSRTIDTFVKIAQSCRDIHNYNAMMEIVSGLNSPGISRLKHSWSAKAEAALSSMSSMIDSNYKRLRTALEEARIRKQPCLPYVGVFLGDLTFIEEGNPDIIPDTRLLNWAKMRMNAGVISKILAFQSRGYTMPSLLSVQSLIVNLAPALSEDEAYEFSKRLEPKESGHH